jgi:hypothetical protein
VARMLGWGVDMVVVVRLGRRDGLVVQSGEKFVPADRRSLWYGFGVESVSG